MYVYISYGIYLLRLDLNLFQVLKGTIQNQNSTGICYFNAEQQAWTGALACQTDLLCFHLCQMLY